MSSILFSIENGIGTITLNRPDKLNAFNREMALAMQKALADCAGNSDVRVVLITGAGKGFSAGQDLAEVVDPNGPGMKRILSEHYNPIVSAIREMPKPVVAAVNGVAAGAGANIALCCDIVLASETASFIQAFSKIGLIPDSGGTYFLPRLVGWQRALALAITGDKIPATEAQQMGMVYRCFPAEMFAEKVQHQVNELANMPTKAISYIKQAFSNTWQHSLDEQLRLEDTLQQKSAKTHDFEEGVQAFIEKRKPEFTGQ